MVLAEILTQPPMSQWASESQAACPESVTKKCAYVQWVLRRFDEWKLSKVHCLRKYSRNVTYYIITIIVIIIMCCCLAAKGTVLASQDGVCSASRCTRGIPGSTRLAVVPWFRHRSPELHAPHPWREACRDPCCLTCLSGRSQMSNEMMKEKNSSQNLKRAVHRKTVLIIHLSVFSSSFQYQNPHTICLHCKRRSQARQSKSPLTPSVCFPGLPISSIRGTKCVPFQPASVTFVFVFSLFCYFS